MFLSKISLRNPVLITMVTVAIIIFGLLSVRTLGVELLPSIDIPMVTVSTIYAGADAATIEEDVVKRIEDSVGTLNGIKHINSTAIDNVGLVVVQFEDHMDGAIATQSVRDKVAIIKSDLPEDADDPMVEQFDVNAQAIVSLILKAPSGEKLSKVTRFADKEIKNRIQAIAGVGSVDIYGGRERELRVLMNPLKIDQLNLSSLDLIHLIKSKSVEVPGGSLKILKDFEEVSIRSTGEAETVEEMTEIPLMIVNGETLRVKDVARIEDGLEEEESASFYNLTPAVALKVKKQGAVNLVKLSEEIQKVIDEIQPILPEGYEIGMVGDLSPFTKAAVGSSVSDIFVGALLAMLIIYIFLMNVRAALIVAVSLPTSIIGTFLFLKVMGMNLNIMTTLALSISVGILTDDAIVVIEAMFRHVKKGKHAILAAVDATKEVGLAVVSAEMALICVFAPTVLVSGTAGKLFKEFGLTVIAAVLISMTVSFTVAPLVSSLILKEERKKFLFYRIMDHFLMSLENGYANAAGWALKHRLIMVVIGVSLFVGGLKLASTLPGTFMPDVDRGEFDIVMELDNESSIDKSKQVNREIVEAIAGFEWESFGFSTIGGGSRKEKNIISLRVKMTPKENRNTSQFEAMSEIRKVLNPIRDRYHAKYSVNFVKAEGMETAPIQVNIVGVNFKDLKAATEELVTFMRSDGGFNSIIQTDKGYKKEVLANFNHQKMADLGVNPAEVGLSIRALLSGEKVGSITDEAGEEVEFVAYIDDAYKKLDYLRSLPMKAAGGRIVKLADVADITYGNKLVEINRYDRQKKIGLKSGLNPGYVVGPQSEKLITYASENFPKGVRLQMAGDAEQMKESFGTLASALVAAVFLIYIVLASQFNSFIHPLTIMTALPFALTGAVSTLFLFDQPLSIMSFIGIIMLMGIVTKNSILLVDYALQRIRDGVETVPALLESSRTRLRPILMTAGGTILGMLPVVLSQANAAEIKHSLGFAVIGGLIFSTFITLFMVPVFFSLLQRFSRKQDEETLKELAKL